MTDTLTLEIIKRILQHVGINPPSPNVKNLALYSDVLRINKVVESELKSGLKIQHPVYAGEIKLPNFLIKGVLIDLSVEDDYEFCFCWRLDQNPIQGVCYSFSDEDQAAFRVYLETSKIWKNVDMYNKAMILAGFEKITSAGLLWKSCSDFDDLFQAVEQLLF